MLRIPVRVRLERAECDEVKVVPNCTRGARVSLAPAGSQQLSNLPIKA
jgi:hypothetical protein